MKGALGVPPRLKWPVRLGRWALLFAALVLLAYLTLCAALYGAMRQTPDLFGRVMMKVPAPIGRILPFETLWMRARAGSLKPGDLAPDFTLRLLDRTETVRLSSFRGSRPVVLVFGSYT